MDRSVIRPGEPAPDFTLPAVMRTGTLSLAEHRGQRPVLLGFFRGLHCPFCRRQIFQLSGRHDALAALGIATIGIVNTPRARAEQYFRHHPVRIELAADSEARTHALYGIPRVVPDASFAAARINPTGELPAPVHPLEANTLLNDRDGFVLTSEDQAIFAAHATQLGAHVLLDRHGIVRWTSIEAEHGFGDIGRFPGPEALLSAARALEAVA